jgi:hypothetical protein
VTIFADGPDAVVLAHLKIFTVNHTPDYNTTPVEREKALVKVSLHIHQVGRYL